MAINLTTAPDHPTMTFLSRALFIFGTTLLSHACYSAYEHASLYASASSQFPLDISLETIISVILICVGLVLGAERLKPITWRVWAGQVERETRGGGGPFQGLEDRVGFMNIRAQRKDFADWVREKGRAKGT
ncbi:MAG: hypothetical protein LQ338_004152 [Usnochroma carphineum]|nr:MAG: hypothetical protein LQ338_004152 [Usnochroma carphineum]